MKFQTNNLASRYAFILCLSIALLFSQTFQAHMHLQHDEHAGQELGHVVDLHIASSVHESTHDTHHQDDFMDHQYHAEVDVSTDSFVKKAEQLNFSMLLFLIVGLIISIPTSAIFSKHSLFKKIRPKPLYYSLSPPLRAPPK